jgi:hypothetical protein
MAEARMYRASRIDRQAIKRKRNENKRNHSLYRENKTQSGSRKLKEMFRK